MKQFIVNCNNCHSRRLSLTVIADLCRSIYLLCCAFQTINQIVVSYHLEDLNQLCHFMLGKLHWGVKSSHLVGLEPAGREVIVGGLGRGAPLARETLAVRLEHPSGKLVVPRRRVLFADCGIQVRGLLDRSGLLWNISLLEEFPDHRHLDITHLVCFVYNLIFNPILNVVLVR